MGSGRSTPPLLVVAAIIEDPCGRVLLGQRPVGKAAAGKWEFPGGKIEPGETALAALKRELQEELGLQVIAAVHKVEREFGVDNQFFVVECDPETARYSLYYELSPRVKEERLDDKGLAALKDLSAFEKRLDEVLREINMEYDAKRSSDRVKPIRLALLKRGSYEDFKRFYLAAGQREGQFKIVALQYKKDIKFDFAPSIRWDSALTEAANLDLVAASRHASRLSLTTSEVSNG